MKNLKNTLSLMYTLLLIPTGVVGQLQSNMDAQLDQRIKQVDEFLERFNNLPEAPDSIRSLIALIDFEQLEQQSINEMAVQGLWQQLLDVGGSKDPLLAYEDTTWMARLLVTITIKGKKHPIDLRLQPIYEPKLDYVSWRIVDVKGPFTRFPGEDIRTISPVSHNMDFMHLTKNMDVTPQNFSRMVWQQYEIDPLTALITLFDHGLAQLESIDQVVFVFRQVPGHSLVVEERKRERGNSGWLITHIAKDVPTLKSR